MYHARFKSSHYNAGYHWGNLLLKNGNKLSDKHIMNVDKQRLDFSKKCLPIYQEFYPEVIEEIRGIADGQQCLFENLCAFLLSMYCFEFSNKCTCFAYSDENQILFARNSDFLVELEKLYMNCLYKLDNACSFNGNTTAFVQMEDGINEYGLAVGLTFVYPHIRKPGLNSGMLVRYLLEKCKCTKEAIDALHTLPIASAQTLTIADANGEIVVVECNSNKVEVVTPKNGDNFVVATNNFETDAMKKYRNPPIDDWRSDERYHVTTHALQSNPFSINLAKNILSGKYGFMCQYDRKTGADTVWSVIYDIKHKKIFRVEGNPSRKKFVEDTRLTFNESL